jgi:hypothetical protein
MPDSLPLKLVLFLQSFSKQFLQMLVQELLLTPKLVGPGPEVYTQLVALVDKANFV